MVAGTRRGGKPRTDAERSARHYSLYGNTNLPPRGTGLGRTYSFGNTSSALVVGIIGVVALIAMTALRK